MDIDNPNNGLMESLASLIGNTPLLEIIFLYKGSFKYMKSNTHERSTKWIQQLPWLLHL